MIIAVPADEDARSTPRRIKKAAEVLITADIKVYEAIDGQLWTASPAILSRDMSFNESRAGYIGHGGS